MSYIFHKEDISFRFLNKHLVISWFSSALKKERKKGGEISFIFCSDEYLLQINRQHLKHDYYTDIITFDYSVKDLLSGDIYISIDRVKENAGTYNVTFQQELLRVMIHGVLHLCGYKDKTTRDARLMREKEDYYLSLWSKNN